MKRRTERITLLSCWEQLRTGKAWRRLSLVLLVAVMTMTAQTARADNKNVSVVTHFGTLIVGYEGKSNYYTLGSNTYTLTANITTYAFLKVPDGVTAVIDLNGHTIDRGQNTFTDNGSVIRVEAGGSLTIKDSQGGGIITGNSSTISNEGTMFIFGGTIIGSSFSVYNNGGTLYVFTGATLQNGIGKIGGTVVNPVVASVTTSDASVTSYYDSMDDAVTRATAASGSTLTLWDNVTVNSRIDLTGDTNLILGDGCTLNVKGIFIPHGSTLTVNAQSDGETAGKIVSHPSDGAAIGGKPGNDNGNIVIHGGKIEATGGEHCAGIGSADGQTGGDITIYGGTVTAKGGDGGAAIGGGRDCSGGTITIYGGDITANGPTVSDTCENGAGIGGGDCGNGGTITINGGTITTYSRDGAGIGGGDDGDGGNITIYGGTITSNKVNQGQGARIGGGCDGGPGTITINGGTITTVGGTGAGIGGGKGNPAGGTITINGGTIDASGSYGIGAGQGGADVAITLGWTKASDCINPTSYNGSVTIADGKSFYNGSEVLSSGIVTDMSKLDGKTLGPCVLLTVGANDDYSDRTSGLGSWAGTDMTVAFQRSFTDGAASTVCLPFPMTSITGGNVYGFRGITWDATLNNEGGWVATMIDQSPEAGNLLSATEANKPYLFMPNATGDVTFTGTIASVPAEITAGSTTSTDNYWTFQGTYSRLTYSDNLTGQHIFGFAASTTAEDKEKGQDAVTAGEFVKAIDGAYFPAFRAYLAYTGTEESLKKARGTRGGETDIPETITVRLIGKDGEIDGIGEIRLSTGEVTFDSNAWYDLNGGRLDGKPSEKGIYINGGRKVVIK